MGEVELTWQLMGQAAVKIETAITTVPVLSSNAKSISIILIILTSSRCSFIVIP